MSILIDDGLLKRIRGTSGFWYLATPYTKYHKGIEEANREACIAADELIQLGVNVFSPIAHSHAVSTVGSSDALDHELWMRVDRSLMHSAIGILVLKMPGWMESDGVTEEIDYFIDSDKEIHFIDFKATEWE